MSAGNRLVVLVAAQGGLRAALLAALLASLAGCAPGIDAGQGRLCRAIIPALNGEASAIEIVRTAPLAAGHGVRVDYRGQSPRVSAAASWNVALPAAWRLGRSAQGLPA